MSNLSRRQFLQAMAATPFLGLSLPRLAAGAPAAQGDSSQPNIIMMVFDTFSARHMSLLGYPRETTPNLTRLAERATVFHQHYAGGNFTAPGTSSLLTSLYPWYHRNLHNYGHVLDSVSPNNLFNLLPDAYHSVAYTHNSLASTILRQLKRDITDLVPRRDLTLADALWSEMLFPNDYPVSIHSERLFQGHSLNSPAILSGINKIYRNVTTRTLSREYKDLFPRGLPGGELSSLYALYILDNVMDWVNEQANSVADPYAFYVHVLPPHGPYRTRHDFIDIFDDGWQPVEKPVSPFDMNTPQEKLNFHRRYYDEFVAYVDAEFARLFDMLEQSGALENTYLILTSDHGELFERGIFGHTTFALNDPVLHIPLMIWAPGQQTRVDVHERTSAVDMLPTLLHLTGQTIPDLCEGVVLPTFGGPIGADRAIYGVEGKSNNKYAPLTNCGFALYQGPYKLLNYRGYDDLFEDGMRSELYNLENDPEELEDLFQVERGTAEAMMMQLEEKIVEVNRPFQRG